MCSFLCCYAPGGSVIAVESSSATGVSISPGFPAVVGSLAVDKVSAVAGNPAVAVALILLIY